jgi:hypothetical protein
VFYSKVQIDCASPRVTGSQAAAPLQRTASYKQRMKELPTRGGDLPWVSEPEPDPEPEQQFYTTVGVGRGGGSGEQAAWERERAAFEAERATMRDEAASTQATSLCQYVNVWLATDSDMTDTCPVWRLQRAQAVKLTELREEMRQSVRWLCGLRLCQSALCVCQCVLANP